MPLLPDRLHAFCRSRELLSEDTHKFGYDAFGNVRTSQGVGADATGGDFRFQGQWLESATGLYNFRARDYDSHTGTFLSRDPVDSTAQDPEALNPYQFVYNNPYVYSDPSGMFTMVELNAAFSAQNSLQAVKTYSGVQIKQYFKSKVGEALGNAFTGFVKKLLPFNGLDSFDALPKRFQDGIQPFPLSLGTITAFGKPVL